MADRYVNFEQNKDSPAESAFLVEPLDAQDLDRSTRALYVGVGGDVRVVMVEDVDPVTFVDAPSGSILPIRVRRVLQTGTTADAIVALV